MSKEVHRHWSMQFFRWVMGFHIRSSFTLHFPSPPLTFSYTLWTNNEVFRSSSASLRCGRDIRRAHWKIASFPQEVFVPPGSARFWQTAGSPESLKHTCVGIKRPVVRFFSSAEVKLILHTLVISLSGSTGRDSFNWKRSHGREHCVHVKSRSGICPARNNYPDARQTRWSFRSFTAV